jgi:hypothetical protein
MESLITDSTVRQLARLRVDPARLPKADKLVLPAGYFAFIDIEVRSERVGRSTTVASSPTVDFNNGAVQPNLNTTNTLEPPSLSAVTRRSTRPASTRTKYLDRMIWFFSGLCRRAGAEERAAKTIEPNMCSS